jgi:hypothetical protein
MKKLFNYSFLLFLFAFVAVGCSKESDDVNPTASLSSTSQSNVLIGGYDIGPLTYVGNGMWSFTVAGPGKDVQGAGLSHLNIKLTDCDDNLVPLSSSYIHHAKIVIGDHHYTPGHGFNLEYTDGSCRVNGMTDTNLLKFEMMDGLSDLLKKNTATFYFTFKEPYTDLTLKGASVTVKTGNQDGEMCFTSHIMTYEDYCDTYEVCSFSQGRYFNKGNRGKHWPMGVDYVYVGNRKLKKGVDMLPAKTDAERALFQAGALVLSAKEQGITWSDYFAMLPESVRNAYTCIATYYTNGSTTCDLQAAAGTIGDWIDANHCME